MSHLEIVANQLDLYVGLAVVPDSGQQISADGFSYQHLMPTCQPAGHAERRGGGLKPVVRRDVDHVHVQELAHHAGVLEQRLKPAVIVVRLARVGGQELASPVHLVAHGWHVMLIAPSSQEAEVLPGRRVSRQNVLHMPFQGIFGQEGRGQIHFPADPEALRDILVEILSTLRSDLFEHLRLHCGHRIGDIGVNSRLFLHHCSFF